MTRFIAETLDLSRLPNLTLVGVDYEAERANLIAGFKARAAAVGLDYDVEELETDPFIYLAEEFAYRKTLTLAQINDAGKRLTLAYAYGEALDHIAATYYADVGVARLVVEPANPQTGAAAVLESDERFRMRIQLAPETRTPGTLGGYEYWALTAAPRLVDAVALNHASGLVSPGQVLVVLLGGSDEAEQVTAAQEFLLDRRVKLGSDTVIVRAAKRVTGQVNAVLQLRSGPAPAIPLAEATAALAAYTGGRRRISKAVTMSGLYAALTVGGVERVSLNSPQADIVPPLDGVVDLSPPVLTTGAMND